MTLFCLPVSSHSPQPRPLPPSQTIIPTRRRERGRARRGRPSSVYSTAPSVGPRESSLYLPAGGSNDPLPIPYRHSLSQASQSTFDIPQYAFFNTQAHTEIWDELFVSARHTTKARVDEYQQARRKLTSATVLGLSMSDTDKRLEEGMAERAMKSEIWTKVGLFILTIYQKCLQWDCPWLEGLSHPAFPPIHLPIVFLPFPGLTLMSPTC